MRLEVRDRGAERREQPRPVARPARRRRERRGRAAQWTRLDDPLVSTGATGTNGAVGVASARAKRQ
jgi:hypothetical protein